MTIYNLPFGQFRAGKPLGTVKKQGLEGLCLLGHLTVHLVNELLYGHGSLFATTLLAHTDKALGLLFLANDDHEGNTFQLVVADFTAQLLVTQVDGTTDTLLVEPVEYVFGVLIIFL